MRVNGIRARRGREGFTFVEALVVLCVLGVVVFLLIDVQGRVLRQGMAANSMNNLRQLASANLSYAADHDGSYCPAQDTRNLTRWHGGRSSTNSRFDPTRGFLAPYLGASRRVGVCLLFQKMLEGGMSFEDGTGGYGYNAAYIGGTPQDYFTPAKTFSVPRPSRTVMFATTAFARSSGLQEYAYAEPPYWMTPNGKVGGSLQPSVHFRANGKALVAWCDGHATAELPSRLGGTEYYGGDSKKQKIGWFGPLDDNGYWNPNYEE